jgi:REP element-mobilizing transposase RayT
MATILQTAQSPALIIGGTSDHVHLLFSLSRTKALADVLADVKADSSKWIKGKGSQYAKFYWQTGYGAFSIGQSNVEALRKYIVSQREHHRKRTFQDEFRDLLAKYHVAYDERYVWD